VFTAGMMATDGLNGWLVAGMARRADGATWVSSRGISLVIGAASLLVAALGALRQFSPDIDRMFEGQSLWMGLMLFALVCCGYVFVMWRAARSAAV
jgi:hypothetical protein